MTQSVDVASALISWATSIVPEIETTHDYPEITDFGPMPDLAVDLRQIRTLRVLQAHVPRKQLEAALSVLVQPRPYRDSTQQLWSMADRLITSQSVDRTLGFGTFHQVALKADPVSCGLPGIIQREDGTEARELVVTFTLDVPA